MARNTNDTFYVILTNTSNQAQPTFEEWNSWGYQAVSFQVQLPDGTNIVVSKKQQGFTKNTPGTFVVPAGEQRVYAVNLNDEWTASRELPVADAEPIAVTLKATYAITPTPEAAKYHVWTGRAESAPYQLNFRHWQ